MAEERVQRSLAAIVVADVVGYPTSEHSLIERPFHCAKFSGSFQTQKVAPCRKRTVITVPL
jgi:hypothetical protein